MREHRLSQSHNEAHAADMLRKKTGGNSHDSSGNLQPLAVLHLHDGAAALSFYRDQLGFDITYQAHLLNEMNGVPRLTTHVALSFSSQLSVANQQTELHTSSRLRACAGTSLALCPPSIASTIWSPLLHKLPVPWLSSPDQFPRRCWWYQSRRGPARRGWY